MTVTDALELPAGNILWRQSSNLLTGAAANELCVRAGYGQQESCHPVREWLGLGRGQPGVTL